MYLKQFFVEGIGHASYMIASDDTSEAAIVDPRRDVDVYVQEAARRGLTIRYALETHNHNDFLSGSRALVERLGTEHVASADADLKVEYHAVREGDEVSLGELRIRVLSTPGHTPEHVTYVVVDTARAEEPVLVFTGGDLLVGGVGRPDLLGRELGEKLAPMLFDDEYLDEASVRRASPVLKAVRSEHALAKDASKHAEDGLPLHSFSTLLRDLGTLTYNVTRTGANPNATISITPRPTPIQDKAFKLLGLNPICSQ